MKKAARGCAQRGRGAASRTNGVLKIWLDSPAIPNLIQIYSSQKPLEAAPGPPRMQNREIAIELLRSARNMRITNRDTKLIIGTGVIDAYEFKSRVGIKINEACRRGTTGNARKNADATVIRFWHPVNLLFE